MTHCTPDFNLSPQEETLAFLKAFARCCSSAKAEALSAQQPASGGTSALGYTSMLEVIAAKWTRSAPQLAS